MPPFSDIIDSSVKDKKPILMTPSTIEDEIPAKFILQSLSEGQEESSSIKSTSEASLKKKRNILTNASTPFLYIRDGDFDIVWPNVIVYAIANVLHAYSFYLLYADWTTRIMATWITCYCVGIVGALGITAGAHRLWAHKSYSASLPFRVFLMIAQCIAGQNSIFIWCRDHRVHHKFSETDGDPHNSNRGFFFAHVGWLLRKKHPKVILDSEKLDFSDLLADPVVRIQHEYYFYLYFIFALIGPSLIPWYFWNESLFNSLMIVYLQRYMTSLHSTWFVNSTAHMFGYQPYDHHIEPKENYFVSYGAVGEGYHNYHHTFPFDYRTSENGCKFNVTKKFIDLMAFLGLAYNLRIIPDYLIEERKKKVIRMKQEEKMLKSH